MLVLVYMRQNANMSPVVSKDLLWCNEVGSENHGARVRKNTPLRPDTTALPRCLLQMSLSPRVLSVAYVPEMLTNLRSPDPVLRSPIHIDQTLLGHSLCPLAH